MMTFVRVTLAMALAFAVVGCATTKGEHGGKAPCQGKCDDATPVAPLRCWVEPGSGLADAIQCALMPPEGDAYHVTSAVAEAKDASGIASSKNIDTAGTHEIAAVAKNRYPVDLHVRMYVKSSAMGIRPAGTPLGSEGLVTFERTVRVTGAADFTATAPLEVTVPLSFWSATIARDPDPKARFEFSFPDYAVSTAPLTVVETSSTNLNFTDLRSLLNQPTEQTFYFATAPGTSSLTGTGTASVLGTLSMKGQTVTYPITIEAGGAYLANLEGFVAVGADTDGGADAGTDDGGTTRDFPSANVDAAAADKSAD